MPNDKYYWLTENDREFLDRLQEESRSRTPPQRYETPDPAEPSRSRVYVIRTPLEGIPALTGALGSDSPDIPGFVDCNIYEIIRDYPTAIPYLRRISDRYETVYNLNTIRIGGNRWVNVICDEFGKWYAIPPQPSPSEDDTTGYPGYTGTGTMSVVEDEEEEEQEPPFPDTGTGTNPDTGGPGGGGYPCGSVSFEETDVFCEPGSATLSHVGGGLGTGSGTGTDPSATAVNQYYLNLYKRTVYLSLDPITGCLLKQVLPWIYVRTVGCCEPECVEPDTGTNVPDAATCCADGSLYESVGYTLSGPVIPFCGSCSISGNLIQEEPPDGLRWTNSGGGSTCGGQAILDLTLYCAGDEWRANGRLRRYIPSVFDATQTFDVALSLFGLGTLQASVPVPGCADMTLLITLPCYSYNCDDGDCVEVSGDGGTYATIEECESLCEPDNPGTIETGCCPDDLVPETLYGTFSGAGEACLTGQSWEFTYNAGLPSWQSEDISLNCPPNSCQNYLTLSCNGSNIWEMSSPTGGEGCCFNATGLTATSVQCDPFVLTFNVPLSGGADGCGSGTAVLTITG